ncbi:MAG TPA: DUF4911 domain-containing protein [Syntrophales bacterium]|nr:DUF4911 domain-containing protein [Syntrophales bacterium]HPI55910.1 DUF4911 domain-containing protein [Syntrophales bacterium]HPN23599.1 DUF4911 domain-containing protein [Syntrophales bacterium]HQM27876.1 DUF4911 domain-containing protein [Syntrophales bacterium]
MVTKYIRVKPEEIAYFQFLVEGYEGMGTLTTVDPEKGLLRLSIPRELSVDAEEMLRLIGQDADLEEMAIDRTEQERPDRTHHRRPSM